VYVREDSETAKDVSVMCDLVLCVFQLYFTLNLVP
jgi:hypothetical protein